MTIDGQIRVARGIYITLDQRLIPGCLPEAQNRIPRNPAYHERASHDLLCHFVLNARRLRTGRWAIAAYSVAILANLMALILFGMWTHIPILFLLLG